jgi:hypothetical protein
MITIPTYIVPATISGASYCSEDIMTLSLVGNGVKDFTPFLNFICYSSDTIGGLAGKRLECHDRKSLPSIDGYGSRYRI